MIKLELASHDLRAPWFLVEHHCSISENTDEVLCKIGRDQFLQVRDVNRLIKAAEKIVIQDPSRQLPVKCGQRWWQIIRNEIFLTLFCLGENCTRHLILKTNQ
ncbi:hypothetical protein PHMEG_00033489 [Phytophthora megakarya]|uniref:Uncharacterized protein n=1 Tax=Phytophthora megakarya TaxID=4795 RepID=A0A225UTH1_9STRA|nr:hypothetical protein PHMEG_00033489 [Phytophthora megakarya]